jgi:hypothetical protein
VKYDDSIPQDGEENYMLQMEFLKKPKKPSETLSPQAQEKLGSHSKEMALNLRNCKIVFDKEVWERVYAYLLSGGRGKRFAKYAERFLELTRHQIRRGELRIHGRGSAC